MNKEDFLKELQEIMQRDEPVAGNEEVSVIDEWDSMTILGVMSFFDMEFSIDLSVEQMNKIKNIQELIALAGDQIVEA